MHTRVKLPPGPGTFSLWQTLHLVAQPIEFLQGCAQRYGNTFTTRVLGIGSPPIVFLGNPEAIAQIFTAPPGQFELGKVTHVFRPLTGEQSLIMLDGDRHQSQRQLLMPLLQGDRMRAYGQRICEITQAAIAQWPLNHPFCIREVTLEISLQVILQVVFGINPGPRYHQLKHLLSRLLEDICSPIYSSQFFFPPLQRDLGPRSPWGSFLRQQQQIDQLIYAEIQERRQQGTTERGDVLSQLIADTRQAMPDQAVRDQLMTLLLLGHETTASALAWAFYWIHQEPEVRERLQQELIAVGAEADPNQLAQLPYLNAVCKEALRVYPIALISQPRKVKEPVEIEGYQFDPGTILVPCIYLAHRHSQTYLNPDQFQPERFLARKFTPYEFLPFGGGPRSCIGAALSLHEMKLVLAMVLLQYELEQVSRKPVKPVRRGITFVPSQNFRLQAIARRQPKKVLTPQ